MSLFPTSIDYTDKDFAALVARLDHLIAAAFPNWTDVARANFGNILKEACAFVGDVIGFYQDQMARETRWGTATQRYAIISLARLIGYELEGAHAATVELSFSTVSPVIDDLTIEAGTRIKTKSILEPVYFTLLSDAVIIAGNTSTTGDAEHSEEFVDSFTVKGEKDEEFVLANTPFLDNSQAFVVGLDTWAEVDNFLDSGPTDQHYIVLVDQNDKATVRTGDGTNGAIPSAGAAAAVTYKTGGGEVGNVEANSLTRFVGGSGFTDDSGNPITLSVNNASNASGGTNRETIAQARVRAPRSLRVLNRAIARTDFEDVALQLTYVARALMLTINEDATVPEGRGYMYVVPVGGGDPTTIQRTSIYSYIQDNYPWPLNFSWEIRAVTPYKVADIKAWLYLDQDANPDTVVTNVRETLSAYFAPLNEEETPNTEIDWGFYYKDQDGNPDPIISWSHISDLIDDVAGIRRLGAPGDGEGLLLYGRSTVDPADPDSGTMENIDILVREFPKAGNIKLINATTAAVMYDGSID